MKRRTFLKFLGFVPVCAAVEPSKLFEFVPKEEKGMDFMYLSDGGYIVPQPIADKLIAALYKQKVVAGL